MKIYVATYDLPNAWATLSPPPRIRLVAAETLAEAVGLAAAETLIAVQELRFAQWPSHGFAVEDILGLETKHDA